MLWFISLIRYEESTFRYGKRSSRGKMVCKIVADENEAKDLWKHWSILCALNLCHFFRNLIFSFPEIWLDMLRMNVLLHNIPGILSLSQFLGHLLTKFISPPFKSHRFYLKILNWHGVSQQKYCKCLTIRRSLFQRTHVTTYHSKGSTQISI